MIDNMVQCCMEILATSARTGKSGRRERVRHQLDATKVQPITDYPSLWKREMFEALDLVRSEVERRFDQEGLRVAAGREQAILEAAQGKQVNVGSPDLIPFSREKLCLELDILTPSTTLVSRKERKVKKQLEFEETSVPEELQQEVSTPCMEMQDLQQTELGIDKISNDSVSTIIILNTPETKENEEREIILFLYINISHLGE
uniref:Uncharacterized protein n=1 Tax=Knipowitschia caucasica TaxID=637954 RepID=A0AAV2JZY7_KNICA